MSDEKIYIYHTNDIHSNLTYWPRIANELREKRAMREEAGDFVLAFDIGDATDRVHPLTEATDGQAITELLNEGLYDAVTIGNNEGITNSKEQLNNLYNQANFKVILTNLFDKETEEAPRWSIRYDIFETNAETKIGVFGLTVPLYETYDSLGWKVTNPIKQIQQFHREHWHEADFWILLSHLGIDDDRFIAKLFQIPLILGAHTHHVLQHGEYIAGTMLTGAGQFGNWLGEVVISTDRGKLRVESANLLNVQDDLQPAPREMKKTSRYLARGHELLKDNIIAKLPQDFTHDWAKETELAEITLAAIADYAGTEAAFINAGIFMGDLNKGIVTADDFHKAFPHPIRLMHVKVLGKYLLQFAKEIDEINENMTHRPVKGFGFRGKVFGQICFKGLHVNGDEVKWLGEPIDPEKEYELATIDYLSFLPFLDTLNKNSEQVILYPHFIRTVVGEYFKKIYPYRD